MSVKSQDLINGVAAPRRRPGAIVSRAQLARSRGWFERILAVIVWLTGFAGTLFTCAGGVAVFLAAPDRPLPWLMAALVQVLLTALQWWYRSIRVTHPIYLGALAADVATTAWGHGWYVAPPLALWLATQGVQQSPVAAWLLIAVLALFAAWYPEHVAVDD